jgi:hypothetical protein
MKKVLNFLLLASPFYSLAQTDFGPNRQKEKFCLVYVYPLGAKYDVAIDDGNQNKADLQFDSVDAIFNYMAQSGWVLSTSAANIMRRGTSSNFVLIYKQLLAN